MTQPFIGIVVISWNGIKDTLHCLSSLRRLDYENWRAVLVDNASEDGTVEAVRNNFPEVEIIQNATNRGYAEGNNQGIHWALEQGVDWVLLLNNDIVMQQDSLREMVRVGESQPGIGVVGAAMQRTMRPEIHDLGGDLDFRWGNVLLRYRGNEAQTCRVIDYVWGCTLMARAAVFEHTGGLNPLYVAYFEDAELCLRARQELNLKTVVAVNAEVIHKVGASGEKRFVWQTYLRMRNHVVFFLRFAKWQHLPTLLPAIFLYHLPLIFVRSLRVYLARTLRRAKYSDRPITLTGYHAKRPDVQQIEAWLEEYDSARG